MMQPDVLLSNPVSQLRPLLRLPVIMVVIYAGAILWLVPGYFKWNWNVYLALAAVPFMASGYKGALSMRYIVPACLALLLAVLLPVKTALFTALLLALLLLVESHWGKVSPVVLLLILLVSPVFGHITRLFELPIRLWLSERAAFVLQLCGRQATATGNQIMLDGNEFAVDPACAGLNMLVTSLVICLLVVGIHQHKLNRRLGFRPLLFLIIVTILLNVLSNFLRILLLVLFKAMPDTVMHDAIGVFCLLLYVVLPVLYIIRVTIGRLGTAYSMSKTLIDKQGALRSYINMGLLLVFGFAAYHHIKIDSVYQAAPQNIAISGYQKDVLTGGILKFHNADALIYLKPTAFYAPEHDPTVCWVGSGYQFKSVKKENITGREIYTGLLQKGQDQIYTAWWFDSGQYQSVSQLQWRWQAIRHDRLFYLVNVNASSRRDLLDAVSRLSNKNMFNQ